MVTDECRETRNPPTLEKIIESHDLCRRFLDQTTYNASFMAQSRERERRGDLLAPQGERAIAELMAHNDRSLFDLARIIAASDEVTAQMLRAKAYVVLSQIAPDATDLGAVASRSLAQATIAYLCYDEQLPAR